MYGTIEAGRVGRQAGPERCWKARDTRRIAVVLVLTILTSLLAPVCFGPNGCAAAVVAMRHISIELTPGSSSFVVTVASKRMAGKFPVGFVPVNTPEGVAFPLRAAIETMGGTVRFEKSNNAVYFGLGPVTGAYELGTRALIDAEYAALIRKDLFHVVGKTGTLYVTYKVLDTLISQSGGTVTSSTKGKTTTIVCQIPSSLSDVLGNRHDTFPAKAGEMRLVTLAPNLAENCFALGQGGNIIAASEYTDFPQEATKIPTVGAFNNPSLEKLLVLSPDLILVTDGTPLAVVDRLKKMGRTVYADDPKTLTQIVEAIRQLGVVLGVPDRGFEVALSMNRAIGKVHEAATRLPRKPSIYVEIWNSPLMSAGKGTFISDLISVAGGTNIGDDTGKPWPTLSEEFVIGKNPDIIVVASGMGQDDVIGRASFSMVKAVKANQVFDMNGDYIFRPSPRIITGLELIAGYVQRAAGH